MNILKTIINSIICYWLMMVNISYSDNLSDYITTPKEEISTWFKDCTVFYQEKDPFKNTDLIKLDDAFNDSLFIDCAQNGSPRLKGTTADKFASKIIFGFNKHFYAFCATKQVDDPGVDAVDIENLSCSPDPSAMYSGYRNTICAGKVTCDDKVFATRIIMMFPDDKQT